MDTSTNTPPVKLKGGWAGKKPKDKTIKYMNIINNTKNQKPEEKEVQIEDIKGLVYKDNYITQEEHDTIIQQLDGPLEQNWANDLKRRVQQYGYRFIYETQQVDLKNEALPIPDFLLPILQRLVDDKLFPALPDQMIINEYLPGQGITPHVDKIYCFEEPVASISLLSDVAMEFRHKREFQKKTIRLKQYSMMYTKGEARYDWTHGIPTRESDVWEGEDYARSRRISLTFRIVKPDYIDSMYEKCKQRLRKQRELEKDDNEEDERKQEEE